MSKTPKPRLLVLETSGRVGQVALAEGPVLRGVKRLEEARRHARDLAPAVRDLLAAHGWQPRDVAAVIVGLGPGSYTGLRVGIMSAKALAYATGCALLAIDTFLAIAQQVRPEIELVDVLADAQQDRVYVQGFGRRSSGEGMEPRSGLRIEPFAEWLKQRPEGVWASGPGLRSHEPQVAGATAIVDASCWDPRPESLLQLGLERFLNGERDNLWAIEPLYMRPSSAEEQWNARRK
jgi:tRNA threonylcarbamoyladenosine biosynthesis protein TsaB